jgi:hypothetical protein
LSENKPAVNFLAGLAVSLVAEARTNQIEPAVGGQILQGARPALSSDGHRGSGRQDALVSRAGQKRKSKTVAAAKKINASVWRDQFNRHGCCHPGSGRHKCRVRTTASGASYVGE